MCITLKEAQVTDIISLYWRKENGIAYKGYSFNVQQYKPTKNALLIFIETEHDIRPQDILDTESEKNNLFDGIYDQVKPKDRSSRTKGRSIPLGAEVVQRGSWNIVIENDLNNIQCDIDTDLKAFIGQHYAPYCKAVFLYFNNDVKRNICPIIIKHIPHKGQLRDQYLLTAMEAHGHVPNINGNQWYNVRLLIGSDQRIGEKFDYKNKPFHTTSTLPLPKFFQAIHARGKGKTGDIGYNVEDGTISAGIMPAHIIK